MIKTKKWREAESESDVKMHVEDWMADEIDGLREELTEAYKQRAELLEALKMLHRNFRSQHASLLILGAPDFVYMDKVADQAITRAEAAE